MARIEIIDQINPQKTTPEVSVTICLNGKVIARSQATPRNLEELAIGFLVSEDLIKDRSLFKGVNLNTESFEVYVYTDEDNKEDSSKLKALTSSGAALTLDATSMQAQLPPKNTNKLQLCADDLLVCMEELCADSPLRNSGECTHACGLGSTQLECVREDIGRHNALDKLFGQAWLDELALEEMAVFTTGRISYEVLLKTARAGISVVVSRKGITDSAAHLAQELGITTVAYCRNDSMSIYTHPTRITNA